MTARMAGRISVIIWLAVTAAACGDGANKSDSAPANADIIDDAGDLDTDNTDDAGGASDTLESQDGGPQDGSSDDALGTDASGTIACPGGPGCACDESDDCDNNLCIDTPTGKQCGTNCIESCPTGFACQTVSRGGADVVQICVPKWGFLCAPCQTDEACTGALGDHGSRCIDYGGGKGNFCGSSCDADADCPAGYGCKESKTVSGESRKACVRKDLVCQCSARAVAKKLSTTCEAKSALGSCPGTRTCTAEGPIGDCTAPAAAKETCDGVDNDCNGKTDDGLCDDDNPCTTDGCVEGGTSCGHTPVKTSPAVKCDDGDACTNGDNCDEKGKCGGKSIACDDKNPCTDDSCNVTKGCVYKPHKKPCNDGSACTSNDLCDGKGACVGLNIDVKVTCDDSNVCTKEGCDPKAKGGGLTAGCTHSPAAGTCEDGNPCTNGDACAAGKCAAGKNVCACEKDSECSDKEDGNLCNGTLYCNKAKAPFVCDVDPKTLVTCNASGDTTCSKSVCAPKTGKCSPQAAKDATACDADNSVCTTGDACLKGVCKPGKSVDCDDKNVCTNDACDPTKGCKSTFNVAKCEDGDLCTTGDICASGKCAPGKLTGCDDKSGCTKDACNKKTGKCEFDATPFEGSACNADNSVCTKGDKCTKGVCAKGPALVCDDKKLCTDDSCDNKTGCKHLNNSKSCDADGNACTQSDGCSNGLCKKGPLKTCNDKKSCTVDSCDTKTGNCVFNATKLHGSGCDADGSKCTVADKCDAGTCKPGKVLNCDDGKFCTVDSCDKATGCEQVPTDGKACNDGDDCTKNDACKGGGCSGQKLVCSDGNPCTNDSCGKGGCKFVKKTDGSGCGGGKYCVTGACVTPSCGDGFVGQGETCDDGNNKVCDGCEKCAPRGNLVLGGKGWAQVSAVSPTKGGLVSSLGLHRDITVEVWVRPEAPSGTILAKAHKSMSTTTFALMLSGGQPVFMHSSPFGTEYFPAKVDGKAKKIPTKAWTHLAVVIAGKKVRLYVNGKRAGGGTSYKDRLEAPTAGLVVGRRWWDTSGGEFIGKLDELHVANAPLYGGDFVPLRKVRADRRTAGLWHFDAPGAKTASDAGPFAHHLALKTAVIGLDDCLGRPVTTAVCGDGKVDSLIESCDDGNAKPCDGCENCQQERSFRVDEKGAMQTVGFPTWAADAVCKDCTMTVEAWVQVSKTTGTFEFAGASCGIFSLMYSSTPSGTFFGMVRFPLPPLFGSTPVKPGVWYHIAAVMGFDKGAPMRLYVNGKLEKSVIAALPAELPGWQVAKEVLLMGGGSKGTGQGCVFKQEKPLIANNVPGRIDEVRLSAGARYAANFNPRRRLLPDAQTRGLWHFDAAAGLSTDDGGQGVETKLVAGVPVADACYGELSSAAMCGDGKQARWEACDDGAANGGYPKKCDLLCAETQVPDCTSLRHKPPVTPVGTGAAVYGKGAWTVEGWVRLPALPVGTYGAIVSVDEPSSIPGKGCGAMPGAQAWRVAVGGGGLESSRLGGATEKATAASLVWRKGIWQHFAMQYHGDTTGSLWVDGRLVRSFTGVKNAWAASCPLRVGNHFAGSAHPLGAEVAALRWSKATRYGEPFIPPTTFAPDKNTVWQFNLSEGAGSVATDVVKGFKLAVAGVSWSKAAGPGCAKP
ncbi:MAG: DUF4215 domain-containing protein [Myxococcales bacterium]|nr:DUF4215 domain-containing protein [Myxococcales bacterium]